MAELMHVFGWLLALVLAIAFLGAGVSSFFDAGIAVASDQEKDRQRNAEQEMKP